MTDHNPSMPDAPEGGDLELIVNFLNNRLDPERVAQVRQRLEDDAAFRDLAAPMLYVWSVPKHLDRHPRPAGELEKHWDEFTRRAGFVHQRRKTRRRRLWMLAIAVFALGVSALVLRKPIASWYDDQRNYYAVRAETGPVALPDGSRIHMSQNATVRASRTLIKETQRVKLKRGSARFEIVPNDSGEMLPGVQPVVVETRGGTVFAARGEFTVTVFGDTTIVDVHRQSPASRRFIGFVPVPTAVLVDVPGKATPMSLAEGSSARLVRGRQPERPVRDIQFAPIDPSALAIAGQEIHAAAAGGDVTLRDSTRVTLGAGARLSAPTLVRRGDVFTVSFVGSARFVVAPTSPPAAAAFGLEMPSAFVTTSRAEFAVTTRGDTVEVEVFPARANEGARGPITLSMSGADRMRTLTLGEGDRARSVRGTPPVRLQPTKR